MNDPMNQATIGGADAPDPLSTVMRYHQETKHHFARYARSLGYLDWANQPNPFRRYQGSPLVALPLLNPNETPRSPLYDDLYRDDAIVSTPVTVRSISRFFEYSLAISAWKQAGDVRWALRANPSSGNLHPTEGYLLIDGIGGLSPLPGLHHYAAQKHALELRAELPRDSFDLLMQAFPPHAFLVGFTSVNWRETWKYGERAFRYCQHDVGHAIGSACIAARTLGWRMLLLDGVADDTIAALLGLDRLEDFEGAEREHPDCLAVVCPTDEARAAAGQTISVPLSIPPDALREMTRHTWHGKANRLSRGDPVSWEVIDQVELASWKSSTERSVVEWNCDRSFTQSRIEHHDPRATSIHSDPPTAGEVIRRRRSALAFDGETWISVGSFFAMLTRVMPHAERDLCDRPLPWDVLPWAPSIHLVLFVHRVDGLVPGLYMLVRDPMELKSLAQAMRPQFEWTSPPDRPNDLPLFLLQEGDARQLATEVSCHQDIAGDGAFSLGMIAAFESSLHRHGPWFYRRLFWETGLIGQVLYLEAEAAGVRATGIGCFFDDPVHQLMGLGKMSYQSLYHFTVGGHVEDPRLTTLPPYGLDH
jgi:SagB-type dehydrogenase family enzyme